jgi:hypothetical protein
MGYWNTGRLEGWNVGRMEGIRKEGKIVFLNEC